MSNKKISVTLGVHDKREGAKALLISLFGHSRTLDETVTVGTQQTELP